VEVTVSGAESFVDDAVLDSAATAVTVSVTTTVSVSAGEQAVNDKATAPTSSAVRVGVNMRASLGRGI
jgi:hypothetical protein